MSCKTVCHSPELQQNWFTNRTNNTYLHFDARLLFYYPWPQNMVGPEPASSQLDVVHHCLGISMDCFLGNWQAHVRVDSIFRGIGKEGNSIPIEA